MSACFCLTEPALHVVTIRDIDMDTIVLFKSTNIFNNHWNYSRLWTNLFRQQK